MASFNEILQKNSLVLIDFSAAWCGPCQMLAPILKEVKDEMGDKLSIIKIDIDKNQTVANKFHVQGVPTLILYKDGNQVWRQSGLQPKHELIKIINSFS
ncbi:MULTISPECIES: thioredoxin [Sphingobacterium]|uniref:Thioredoxin n=1 Tax=Sphingobacterium cellulitidis TaxID=1768011 RepID=A0A8H9KX89_9SPHI|nr:MULTISPECIES: thioredoxin [Sphingobacterium]MBA8988297.1 thioredoxin 1 [Sphingobacterium soli]OYD42506.1 thioredoxin [Sphingobacterium cellulitidis]WFB65343.1 thioredoxin [Sphingobacterium sp. WM]GGE32313.1 thioredoxin [Sphingobacterium soli]